MKLTVKNNQVLFDYSDISMSTLLSSPDFSKARQARAFLRDTNCWSQTGTNQILRMEYTPYDWATEYGNAMHLKSLLTNCESQATYFNIQVADEFEKFLLATEQRCDELRKIEVEKEKALKRKVEWESKCKYGCGRCENLKYNVDLPICTCTGKALEERNDPCYKHGVVQLFNLVPFPSNECPYKAVSV